MTTTIMTTATTTTTTTVTTTTYSSCAHHWLVAVPVLAQVSWHVLLPPSPRPATLPAVDSHTRSCRTLPAAGKAEMGPGRRGHSSTGPACYLGQVEASVFWSECSKFLTVLPDSSLHMPSCACMNKQTSKINSSRAGTVIGRWIKLVITENCCW